MAFKVGLGFSICLVLFAFLALSSAVCAHQPRIVWDISSTQSNPIIVNDPEVSKAYYGELGGGPDYYLVNSSRPFALYVNILIPTVSGYDKRDFLVEVSNSSGRILLLDGSNYAWTPYFESFNQDDYLMGPEKRLNLSAGYYLVKVYSPVNEGRYSLAIGENESFTISETVNTFIALPQLKQHFFNKPVYDVLFTVFGIGFSMVALFILLVLYILLRFRRSMKTRIRP